MECPGSIRLTEGIDDVPSIFAAEGTAAHDLAARHLAAQTDAFDSIGEKILVAGHMEAFEVDEEMMDAVQVYLDCVNTDKTPADELYVEHRFSLESVYPGMFGTSDAVLLQPKQRLLRVYDFKYGKGVAVEAENNPQLTYYGLGSALVFQGFDEIELVIVQPRALHPKGPIRRWRMSVLDLLEFQADLQIAAQKTEDPNSALKAGDHCQFCLAKGFCPELKAAAQSAALIEFTAMGANTPAAPNFLTPEQIALLLRQSDIVEQWINAVREFAHAALTSGERIPGWKLVAKRANRVWRDELDAAMTLHALGVPEERIYIKKLVSPAAAEKLVPKKVRGELAEFIAPGTSSGTTMAREEDPRPEVVSGAEIEFAPVNE
jgi:hypothetical protein